MLKVRVRPAVASERAFLEALQRRASLNNPGDREAMLANPEAIQLPLQQIIDGCVFVAEQDDSIKGFSVILPREDGDSELDGLFVEPACWQQGIGRALVEHSASAARSGGAKSLHVLGNAHAEGFYTACGFETSGTERTRFGMALVMKRTLR
jgi:GNAT superfamily N-acetyltransferase